MRLSSEIQLKFKEVEKSESEIDWMDVANELQYNIAKKYVNGDDNIKRFVYKMRTIKTKILPHWKKYNRASNGYLNTNTLSIDCLFYDTNLGCYTSLNHILCNNSINNITILIAGSIS